MKNLTILFEEKNNEKGVNYALLKREYYVGNTVTVQTEYIVACGFERNKMQWGYGLYYSNSDESYSLQKAIESYNSCVGKIELTTCRLEEIATKAIEYIAYEENLDDFMDEIYMTDYEKRFFFGLGGKYNDNF